MDGLTLPDGGQVTCGLVERPLGCNKSMASAVARRKRMEICRFRIISSADCFNEPVAKRSRGNRPVSSYRDELNLDFTIGKAEGDVSCTYSVMASKSKLIEESCTQSSVENKWASVSDGQLTSIRKSEDLNSMADQNVQFSNSSSKIGEGEGADDAANFSGACVSVKAHLCYTGDSDLTEGGSRGLNVASKASNEEFQPLLAVSSDKIAAKSPSAAVFCAPDVNKCACVSGFSHPSHGSLSICGRRRDMEDSISIVPSFLQLSSALVGSCCQNDSREPVTVSDLQFYGVYDGHGGNQAATYCKDHLHQALVEEIRAVTQIHYCSNTWDAVWKRAFEASFLRIDQEIGSNSEPVAPETVGSTAVVAVVGSCQIIVANCGDSRAVLSRKGQAIPLSVDHKPDREDEMARVEAAGGRVIFWNGHRVLGVLAMSRALGDRYLKPYVIANPEVTCTQRSEDDECLILASDGLWDVLSNDLVCEVARKCLSSHRSHRNASSSSRSDEAAYATPAAIAAAMLTKLALSKGSSDNISVIVVDLMSRLR